MDKILCCSFNYWYLSIKTTMRLTIRKTTISANLFRLIISLRQSVVLQWTSQSYILKQCLFVRDLEDNDLQCILDCHAELCCISVQQSGRYAGLIFNKDA